MKNHGTSISPSASLIARFLVLNDGHFCPLFSLANSIRLVYLSNIYLIDINWLVVGENFITA